MMNLETSAKPSLPLATILFRREALIFILTLVCSVFIFLLSLRLILFTIWDRASHLVRQEIEKEADTIARLLVFEFSHLTELETEGENDRAIENRVKRLLWEKVSFNETIQGIELIYRQGDAQGQHLSYSFFPLDRLDPESERGPQKVKKSFSGAERDLIRIINQEQRVDRILLELINQGQTAEKEMLLRYFPLYIPLPDRGAVYWGVVKVGINIDAMRRFLILLEVEKIRLRQVLAWVMAGVTAFSLAFGLLGFRWLSRKTASPLSDYVSLNQALEQGADIDIASLLTHLKRHEPKNVYELEQLQKFCLRLGGAIRVLGDRLIATEYQACQGRLMARLLSVRAPDPHLVEWAEFFSPLPETWQEFDPNPFFGKMRVLLSLILPPEFLVPEERHPLPPLFGCKALIVQAVLFLADFALGEMAPGGQLQWQVLPRPAGGFVLEAGLPGRSYRAEEISRLLQPFPAGEETLPSLGPFLAAALAERHGGRLHITPRPGGGLNLRLEIAGREGSSEGGSTAETTGA